MKVNARVEGDKLIMEFPAVFTHPGTRDEYQFLNKDLDITLLRFDAHLKETDIDIVLDEHKGKMYWRLVDELD